MDWIQFIIFFVGVFGLFIWNRSESRIDNRHMDTKMEAQRNLLLEVHRETRASVDSLRAESRASIDSLRTESKTFVDALQMEMKDFHKQLIEIERKRK